MNHTEMEEMIGKREKERAGRKGIDSVLPAVMLP